MQIQNDEHLVLFAPGNQAVRHFKAPVQPGVLTSDGFIFDRQGEKIIVHRQTDRVEAPGFQRVDVDFADMVPKTKLLSGHDLISYSRKGHEENFIAKRLNKLCSLNLEMINAKEEECKSEYLKLM